MTSGKMLEHPRVLMVIPQVIWWREPWLETRAQKGEGSEVALGYDWNACLQEQGRRDTDAPLPASLGDEAAAIRDHLAPARALMSVRSASSARACCAKVSMARAPSTIFSVKSRPCSSRTFARPAITSKPSPP